jgi:hypothetical protein
METDKLILMKKALESNSQRLAEVGGAIYELKNLISGSFISWSFNFVPRNCNILTPSRIDMWLTISMFVWLVANGWCWFVLREKYCWLVVGGWFVLREKYCWLVADKPSEQVCTVKTKDNFNSLCDASTNELASYT